MKLIIKNPSSYWNQYDSICSHNFIFAFKIINTSFDISNILWLPSPNFLASPGKITFYSEITVI